MKAISLSYIPNLFTLLNLLCGCLGIVMVFRGDLFFASAMIWTGGFFDFVDGLSARILNAYSEIGKQLDSLADMVTFGILPSVMMYEMIDMRTDTNFLQYSGFLVAVFSAIRLAKFNIDPRQKEYFIGLPTPACALFISGLPFILENNFFGLNNLLNDVVLAVVSLALSVLLVAEIRLFSLKFKDFKWQNNVIRYIFAMISMLTLVIWNVQAIPGIILVYLLLSILTKKTSK